MFSIYGVFPAFTNREVYSEDSLNTWEPTAANRRKIRFYPLKNADGSVVPNAYVVGVEAISAYSDQQDVMFIIRNVKRAPTSAPLPASETSISMQLSPDPEHLKDLV